jgi:hypothetical protein
VFPHPNPFSTPRESQNNHEIRECRRNERDISNSYRNCCGPMQTE